MTTQICPDGDVPGEATVGSVTAQEKSPRTSRLESYTPKYHARVARGVGTARRAAALEKSKLAAKVDTECIAPRAAF